MSKDIDNRATVPDQEYDEYEEYDPAAVRKILDFWERFRLPDDLFERFTEAYPSNSRMLSLIEQAENTLDPEGYVLSALKPPIKGGNKCEATEPAHKPEPVDETSSNPVDMQGVHKVDWFELYYDRVTPENTAELAIAGALFKHFNRNSGEAFPSAISMSKKARCDVRTVKDALERIASHGFIRIVLKGGPRGSDKYQMTLPPELANVVMLEYEKRRRRR